MTLLTWNTAASNICDRLLLHKGVDTLSGDINNKKSTLSQITLSEREMIETLFQYCVSDPVCSRLYHQEFRKNITVFNYLLNPSVYAESGISSKTSEGVLESSSSSMERFGLLYPVESMLCSQEKEISEINRQLWLLQLISKRSSDPILCDVNHLLVVDENDLTTFCVCRPDRICTDHLYDLVLFYLVLILMGILTLMFLGGNIIKIYTQLKSMDKVLGGKASSINALYDAIK